MPDSSIKERNALASPKLNITVKALGPMNRGQLIYFIEAGTQTSGFGALLRRTLTGLYIADMIHAKPVVSWSSSTILNEHTEINGSSNPFEYYYEPVNDISVDEALHSRLVAEYMPEHEQYVWSECGLSYIDDQPETYLSLQRNMARKYNLRLKECIRYRIKKESEQILGNRKVLGIHIRGGDRRLRVKNVANSIPPSMYFNEIDKRLRTEGFDKIFLATDDCDYLDLFIQRYGNQILFFPDAKRCTDNKSSFFNLAGDREHNKYLLGYELIRDMYTIIQCDSFIGGPSNVTMMARVFKGLCGNWNSLVVLDNGICHTGPSFSEVAETLIKTNGTYVFERG